MSKLETNTIDTVSGTNTLTIGSTNTSTIDFSNPANVTLNAAMKNQHAFFAADSSGISVANAATTKMIYGTEIFDLSSAYNTSNGRFTAPEAGYYFFNANWRAGAMPNNGRVDITFFKNGSAAGAIGGNNQQNTNDISAQGSIILNLSTNDYVEVYVNQNGGDTETTSNSNNAGSGGTGFLGYKIIT
jgi:hypothetical protein